MDTLNEYLSSKVEHIATSLYNYSLRAKRSRNNNGYYYHDRDHGLKTIVHSEEENLHKRILHCYNMSKTKTTTPSEDSETCSSLWQRLSKSLWSSSPGSSALQSTVMGDLIGTESGDYMSCDLIDELLGLGQSQSPRREFRVKEKREKKVFPPAIMLLRQTKGGGMPSCFKKEYGEDGRLILKAGRMKSYYEYMEANRENGRLVMKLIHRDDDDDGWLDDMEEEDEKEESGFNFEFENELVKEREGVENEIGGYCWADLRQCASYGSGGGFAHDFECFYLGRYGSAPLRPITSVM